MISLAYSPLPSALSICPFPPFQSLPHPPSIQSSSPLSLLFLCISVVALLGRFIGVKDANIRYLGLEAMTRLARTYGPKKAQAHKDSVLESLRDGDISVRRYVDLLIQCMYRFRA